MEDFKGVELQNECKDVLKMVAKQINERDLNLKTMVIF